MLNITNILRFLLLNSIYSTDFSLTFFAIMPLPQSLLRALYKYRHQ